jgi:hypothetical protein
VSIKGKKERVVETKYSRKTNLFRI